jgi:hypothetical protein
MKNIINFIKDKKFEIIELIIFIILGIIITSVLTLVLN